MTYSASEVCKRAGIHYRQLDYWCRQGILPGHADPLGSGIAREFGYQELVVIETAAKLIRAGMTVRAAFRVALANRAVGDVIHELLTKAAV